eukprot:403341342
MQNKSANAWTALDRQIGLVTALRVDIEGSESDPEVYLSKTNLYPTSEQDSEQQCLNTGSKICIIDNSKFKPGDVINIGIRCMEYCLYTIKILNPVLNTLTPGTQLTQLIESRSISIYSFKPPLNSTDNSGPTKQVLFQFISYAMQAQVELYFSYTNDFTQLQSGYGDQIIDGGKALKFTSEDIGWCTNTCNIYLIASVRTGAQYIVKATTQSDLTFLQDQTTLERNFKSQQYECLAYNLMKAVNDAVISITQYQGDVDITLFYRNLTNDDLDTTSPIMLSEIYQSRLIIIRSKDRQRLGPAGGLIYMCIHSFSDASFTIKPQQLYTFDRYDLQDDTLVTFILDSKDSVYFRYTSAQLAYPVQLNITLQSFNYMYGVPRVFYTVCQSTYIEDCSLTEIQQQGQGVGISELAGVVDNTFKTRTIQFNHSPSSCIQPTNCIYLFTIFNNDLSVPMKTALKITPTQSEPRQVQLLQSYYDILDQGEYQYFQIVLTPTQIQTFQIRSLVVNVTAFNGEVDLYASNITKNPTLSNNTVKSRSQSPWQSVVFNVTGVDLNTKPIYFSVYGNVRSTYQIKFGADYIDTIQAQYLPTTQISQITPLQNLIPTSASVDGKGTKTTIFSVMPLTEGTGLQARDLIIQISITGKVNNSLLVYDVAYGSQSWTNLEGNQVILGSQVRVKDQTPYIITFRSVTNGSVNATALLNFTVEVLQAGRSSQNILDANLDTDYTMYTLDSSKQILIKQLLLDTNGTYGFTAQFMKGSGFMMYKTSAEQIPTFNKDDQLTFQLSGISSSSESDGMTTHTIQTDRSTREGNNLAQCKNASYSIRGGNTNCTMWLAIQCNGVCVVKFSSVLQQAKSRPIAVPQLIRNQSQSSIANNINIGQGTLMRGKYDYYYIPFTRGKLDQNMTVMINKINNDTVLMAKLLFNGYLNYYNWSYPTNASNDLIARSNFTNTVEFIEITSTLLSKCLNNTSCVLLIGVMGNGPQNTSNSSYNLGILYTQNKISQQLQFSDYIQESNQFKNYWFIMDNTIPNWKQTFSLKVNSLKGFANIYINANKPYFPSDTLQDFKSELMGPDFLQITQQDFKQFKYLPKILFMITVKSFTPQVNYTLYAQGPYPLNSTFLNIIDLQANGKVLNTTLKSLTSKPTNNYQLFRYFNYGSKELQFNFTCYNGTVYYIASTQPWQMENSNVYFQIPLEIRSSQLLPNLAQNFSKGQRVSFNVSATQNSQMLCQFCWYYITVFQNSTDKNQASSFGINLTDYTELKSRNISNLSTSESQLITVNKSSPIIRKFIVHQNKNLQIQLKNLAKLPHGYTVILTDLLEQTSNNYKAIQTMKSNDSVNMVMNLNQIDQFSLGQYYYLIISTDGNSSLPLQLSLQQSREVALLKDRQTLVQLTNSPTDFIKYYYYLLPKLPANYTANLTINVLTPGFMPSFYLYRNDIINGTLFYERLQYANIMNSSYKSEPNFLNADTQRQFSIPINMTSQNYNVIIPVTTLQNVTVNQTTLQNVSTSVYNSSTKKNVTKWSMKNVTVQVIQEQNVTKNTNNTVLNQTLYTIAVYWNNFGLTDHQKVEYEITLSSNLSTSLSRFINTNMQMSVVANSNNQVDLSKLFNNKFSKDAINKQSQEDEERLQIQKMQQEVIKNLNINTIGYKNQNYQNSAESQSFLGHLYEKFKFENVLKSRSIPQLGQNTIENSENYLTNSLQNDYQEVSDENSSDLVQQYLKQIKSKY